VAPKVAPRNIASTATRPRQLAYVDPTQIEMDKLKWLGDLTRDGWEDASRLVVGCREMLWTRTRESGKSLTRIVGRILEPGRLEEHEHIGSRGDRYHPHI
jgi:hypothetical protein